MAETGVGAKKNGLAALIEAKNNIIALIQVKMALGAYYKKAFSDEQIFKLQRFFKMCEAALNELDEDAGVKQETARVIGDIVALGEDVLETL